MRKTILLVLIVIFLFAIVACSNISPIAEEGTEQTPIITEYIADENPLAFHDEEEIVFIRPGDRIVFRDIDHVLFMASHVVRAEVLDYRLERISSVLSDRVIEEHEYDRVFLWNTVHRLRVTEVFVGNVEIDDVIEVAQEIYCFFNPDFPNPTKVSFAYGDELIFLLNCYEERGFRPQPMSLAVHIHSVYQVPPSGAGLAYELESVSTDNNLILTVGRLEQIAEEAGLRPAPLPPLRPPAGNDTGTGQGSEEEPQEPSPQPTLAPSPTLTPSPTPYPDNEGDEAEENDTPLVLLRFVIGSLYYTNQAGETLIGDAEPFIVGNRAHVPLRIIAEALGAEVAWSRATRTGYMTKDGITVSIVVNEPLPDDMGMPVIINNRTFVPARYISETFGAEVRWDRDNSAVYVYRPQ
ncbi:MAG: stalk domain-containing protein [Defluviitaleaceae bacterium]|nr:stalk domain-containing protein [Defluviitaleaceae bacterium]